MSQRRKTCENRKWRIRSGWLSGELLSGDHFWVADCQWAIVGERLSSDQLSWWPIVLVSICRVTNCRSEILSPDKMWPIVWWAVVSVSEWRFKKWRKISVSVCQVGDWRVGYCRATISKPMGFSDISGRFSTEGQWYYGGPWGPIEILKVWMGPLTKEALASIIILYHEFLVGSISSKASSK